MTEPAPGTEREQTDEEDVGPPLLDEGGEIEPDYLKTLIRDQVGQFIYNETRRRPMILPVIIEI